MVDLRCWRWQVHRTIDQGRSCIFRLREPFQPQDDLDGLIFDINDSKSDGEARAYHHRALVRPYGVKINSARPEDLTFRRRWRSDDIIYINLETGARNQRGSPQRRTLLMASRVIETIGGLNFTWFYFTLKYTLPCWTICRINRDRLRFDRRETMPWKSIRNFSLLLPLQHTWTTPVQIVSQTEMFVDSAQLRGSMEASLGDL